MSENINPFDKPLLNLSESFYSVQCEGVTTGKPAVFIRLKGCNLSCGLSPSQMKQIASGEVTALNKSDLMENGTATWFCDSAFVWTKGEKKSANYLLNQWHEQDIFNWIMEGRVNLIWTGGEPCIDYHQKAIVEFLDLVSPANSKIFNEIETNGTCYINDDLMKHLHQINCSVKLSNSGMATSRRINEEAIRRIKEHPNHWFKFVVSKEEDMVEIHRDFVKAFDIDPNHICMQPGLDSQADFHERTRFCLEMGKKYGYRALTRLHISAWDKTTGV